MNGNDWDLLCTKAADADTLRRALYAGMEQAKVSGERLVEDYRLRIAETFLLAGITLIPSQHLQDHQFVVSQGIYDAAKKLCNPEKREVGP